MLDYKDAWSDTGRSPIEKEQGLIENYFEELKSLLIDNYLPVNIELLENELAQHSPPTQDDHGRIVKLCNNIMSFLLTLGIPLKECNYHFERTLFKDQHAFDVRFQSWKSKVNVRKQAYIVTFSMENNKLYDMLTSSPTQVMFNGCTYRNRINAFNKKITDVDIDVISYSVLQFNGMQVKLADLSLLEIYQYLKNPAFLLALQPSFQNYTYAFFTITKFSEICNDTRIMAAKILSHSNKVKRHLFRLYILRNAIAHNAESNPYIVFLTANLEHYLRGTITTMFYTSSMIETVNSPESAFQRYLDFYKIAINELEPTYLREKKEHDSINGKIIKNQIIPKDNLLQDWIKLHS